MARHLTRASANVRERALSNVTERGTAQEDQNKTKHHGRPFATFSPCILFRGSEAQPDGGPVGYDNQ